MRWTWVLILSLTLPATGSAQLAVWDTRQHATSALPPSSLAGKNDWTTIRTGEAADSFKGDAVVTNGRIVIVVRQQDSAAEVCSPQADGAVSRSRLRLLAANGEPAERLDRIALVENTKGGACLEADYKTAKGDEVAAKFRVKRGDVAVQAEPGTGAGKLRVECPGPIRASCRIFSPTTSRSTPPSCRSASVEIPSENFILHLTGERRRNRHVRLRESAAGRQGHPRRRRRPADHHRIGDRLRGQEDLGGPHGRAQGLACARMKPADTGKVIALDWTMPFPAQWRVDFSRPNDLTDSWEMLLQQKKDGEVHQAILARRAARSRSIATATALERTVLGTFPTPCWSDPERRRLHCSRSK